MKTCCSWTWRSLLASLVAGAAFSLQAQGDAPDTNATPTNAASAAETGTTNAVHDPVAAAEPTPAPEPERKPAPSSGKLDYSSFKLVSERNIFNGNRSGQRMTATRSSTQQKSVRVESFSLVGTLLAEEKAPVAFFDGTSSELRKALKAGGNIAGFTVKEIFHAGVRLTEGTNTLDVFVGTGMRREDEGLWKSSTMVATYASSSASQASAIVATFESRSGNNNGRSFGRNGSGRGNNGNNGNNSVASRPSGETPAAGDAAEILKRLMEKREKE